MILATVWTMAEAKKDFERGLLTGFQIYDSSPIMDGGVTWSVSLSAKQLKVDGGALVDARTKKDRVFRTLDAAVKAVREIGFRATTLEGQ